MMSQVTSPYGGNWSGWSGALAVVALAAATGGARAGGIDQVVEFDFEQNNIQLISLDPFTPEEGALTGVRFELSGVVDLSATLAGNSGGIESDATLLVYQGLWLDWLGTSLPVAIALDTESALQCDGPRQDGSPCDVGGPAEFAGSVEGSIPVGMLDHFQTGEAINVALVGLATLFSDHDIDVEEHRVAGTLTLTYEFEDAPTCAADVDGSGGIGFTDMVEVLSAWGTCSECAADITGDGQVGFADLMAVLGAWGECP